MKRLPVRYRQEAREDIEAIYLYVLEVSQSFAVAERLIDRLTARCESVGDAPNGGVARPDLAEGIRVVPFDNRAVILYRTGETAVEIVNVFYKGRDYQAMMANKP